MDRLEGVPATLKTFLAYHIDRNHLKKDLAKRTNDILNKVHDTEGYIEYVSNDTIRNWTSGKSKSITDLKTALAIAYVLNLSRQEIEQFLELAKLPKYTILKSSPATEEEGRLIDLFEERWQEDEQKAQAEQSQASEQSHIIVDEQHQSNPHVRLWIRGGLLAVLTLLAIGFALRWFNGRNQTDEVVPVIYQGATVYDLVADSGWTGCRSQIGLEMLDAQLFIERHPDEGDHHCWNSLFAQDVQDFVLEWRFTLDGRAPLLLIGDTAEEFYWFAPIPDESILKVHRVKNDGADWELLADFPAQLNPNGQENKMQLTREGDQIAVEVNEAKIVLDERWPYREGEELEIGLGVSVAGGIHTTIEIDALTLWALPE